MWEQKLLRVLQELLQLPDEKKPYDYHMCILGKRYQGNFCAKFARQIQEVLQVGRGDLSLQCGTIVRSG